MRKLLPMLAVALVCSAALVIAAEVKTITGEAVCGKCALGETKACTNTVTTTEGGKKVTYYLTKNKFFGPAHKGLGICTAKEGSGPKVKVTGDVEEKEGKIYLTPTSEITKAD
jgi:hypothetical protein